MLRLITATLLLAVPALARSDGHPLPLWRLDGDQNQVYLLGSVHLLREQDYPIPSAIYAAYQDADTLIMELDLDDLDPASTQQVVSQLGMIQDGRTLADLMGSEHYAQAERIASEIAVPLKMLSTSEPWLAAITVEQLMLSRLGFDQNLGIESHLVARAGSDQKDVLGLEEFAQQLGYLDSLSIDAQRALLLETLREATDIGPMMDGLIAAWRRGDLEFLEANMLSDMQDYPEIYQALVVARNRDWTGQIEELLDDSQNYLIVVGALHLVGDDSVPAMLRKNGEPSCNFSSRIDAPSDLDHFEVFFAGTTVRAAPRQRHVVPACAGRNSRIRVTLFFAVDKAANQTHIRLHGTTLRRRRWCVKYFVLRGRASRSAGASVACASANRLECPIQQRVSHDEFIYRSPDRLSPAASTPRYAHLPASAASRFSFAAPRAHGWKPKTVVSLLTTSVRGDR